MVVISGGASTTTGPTSVQNSITTATTKPKAPLYSRVMDRLVEVLTDPTLFRLAYTPQHRSAYNEYLSSTGAKEVEVYTKLTSKFETATGLAPKSSTGLKQYHLLFPLPDSLLPSASEPPLGFEALETLQLMAHFFFYQLRLYDEGQDIGESILMILFQSHSLDWEDMTVLGGAESMAYANARSAPFFLEAILFLSRIYVLRFMAMYEGRLSQARAVLQLPDRDQDGTGLAAVYDELVSHTPMKRSRANAIKSSWEMFSVQEMDDGVQQQQQTSSRQRATVNKPSTTNDSMTMFDRPATMSLNRQRLAANAKTL